MLQVSEERDAVKAPVEKLPLSVVVAVSPPERLVLVPHAKPLVVGLAPPVAVMLPFAVAVVAVREDADWVVTVGALVHALVVKEVMEP